MATSARTTDVAAPSGWGAVFKRAAQVAIVGFVVLQIKEYVDAGMFDTLATSVDAVLIATGVLIVDAIRKIVRG